MTKASEGDPTMGRTISSTESMSQSELLWVLSRALLSTQETSNDVIARATLLQYQQCRDGTASLDGAALEDIEQRLDRAVEDIELAKRAVSELQTDRMR